MLKGKSDVGGDDYKAKYLRDQASESQNIQVFVGVVKGDTELKVFYSMVKYNDMFSTNNPIDSVIGFGCLIFHDISHGRGQRWSMLIMQLKCRAILDSKGITIPCWIRQGIKIKRR